VRQQNTEMVTSAMLGTLRSDAMARAEFLRLVE
jgi:GTP cyclohydrolase I